MRLNLRCGLTDWDDVLSFGVEVVLCLHSWTLLIRLFTLYDALEKQLIIFVGHVSDEHSAGLVDLSLHFLEYDRLDVWVR